MSRIGKYFLLILKCSVLLVLMILVHDEYAVVTNITSELGCSKTGWNSAYTTDCHPFVNKLTFSGKYQAPWEMSTEIWLNPVVVVVLIAALLIMKPYKNEQESTSDYILQLNNFKELPSEDELWTAISKNLRVKGAQKFTNKNGIVKIIPFQQQKWSKVTNSALVVFERAESN